eukprot:3503734-Rhodomonas_salina.2
MSVPGIAQHARRLITIAAYASLVPGIAQQELRLTAEIGSNESKEGYRCETTKTKLPRTPAPCRLRTLRETCWCEKRCTPCRGWSLSCWEHARSVRTTNRSRRRVWDNAP